MKKLRDWWQEERKMWRNNMSLVESIVLLLIALIFLSLTGVRCSVSCHTSSQETSK
jgi:hypothetical protein